jgi:hypothetical protein
MSILIPDEYHIGSQSESVVVGVPGLTLLGVSETSAEMRDRLAGREVDVRAAEETMIAREAVHLWVPSP